MPKQKLKCVKCGRGIRNPDDAHFYHEPGCGFDNTGYCQCDNPVHERCCPDCHPPQNRRGSKPTYYNPRDLAILGGDPSQ